jgi:hypothetical protein
LSILIQLAIYAAIAGAAWFAFHTYVETSYVKPAVAAAVAKQLTADTAVLEGVKTEREDWKKQELEREAELEAAKLTIDRYNAAVAANLAASDKLIAQNRALKVTLGKTQASFNADQSRAQQIVLTAQPKMAADEELQKIDAAVRDALGLK